MAKPSTALLRNVRLFSELDERDLESLADEFNERRFSAGENVTLEGEGGLMFFVVETGELSIEQHGEAVASLGPGSSFGEIALIDRRPRTATVTAVSDVKAYGLRSSSSDRSSSRAPQWLGRCSRRWPTASRWPSLVSRPVARRAPRGPLPRGLGYPRA
jgi:signal-transduction protein with cAMP-binding, CBS, and nucleotidyltransferase domain